MVTKSDNSVARVQGLGFKLLPLSEKINNSLKSFSITTINITFYALNTVFLEEIWKKSEKKISWIFLGAPNAQKCPKNADFGIPPNESLVEKYPFFL